MWGHMHKKYKCPPHLCATLPGSEPTATCPALGFTLGFDCAASTEAVPLPWLLSFCFRAPYNVKQKSVDLDEEDVPFTPDEHKKRYVLS